jgi:TPR repeat protein
MRLRNALIGALLTACITPVWAEEGEEAAAAPEQTEVPKAETPAAPPAPAAKQPPKIDEKKVKQLVDEVTKEAHKGNPDAQYSLALLNVMGKGVPRDLKNGLQWFLKAANQGHAIAQHNAGVMYLGGGEGIEQDFNKAISWFKKAADQGYVESRTWRRRD